MKKKEKKKKSNLEEVQSRKQATLELVVDGKFFDFSDYPLHPNAQNSKPNNENKEDRYPYASLLLIFIEEKERELRKQKTDILREEGF